MKLLLCFLLLIATTVQSSEYFNSKYSRELYRPTDTLSTQEEQTFNQQLDDLIGTFNSFFQRGRVLEKRCQTFADDIQYRNIEEFDLALRTVASNFQNILFWNSIRSISFYAQKLNWELKKLQTLSSKLIQNYCSKNLTLFSRERLTLLFQKNFENPDSSIFPVFPSGAKVNPFLEKLQREPRQLKKYLMFSIENFQAACSWGGDTDNFRLLSNFLKDPYIMAYLAFYLEKNSKADSELTKENRLVVCNNLICRQGNKKTFLKFMPLSIGSQGIKDDVERLYCSKIKFNDLNLFESDNRFRNLVSNKTLDEKMNQRQYLYSSFTGFPSLYFLGPTYDDFLNNWYSNIEYYWDQWVDLALDNKRSELLYEESVKIRPIDPVSDDELAKGDLGLNYSISLGEMDRLFGGIDKVSFTVPLTFSESFLTWAAETWSEARFLSDDEPKVLQLKAHISAKVSKALALAEEGLVIPIVSQKLSPLVVDQLLDQLLRWKSLGFPLKSKNTEISIPVRFYYGLFTLRAVREKFIFQNKRR